MMRKSVFFKELPTILEDELQRALEENLHWKIIAIRMKRLKRRLGTWMVRVTLRSPYLPAASLRPPQCHGGGLWQAGKVDRVIWVKINEIFFTEPERGRDIASKEYEILKWLYERFNSYGEGFGVIRPILYLPGIAGIVTQDFRGKSLQSIILRECTYISKRGNAIRYLFDCGRWLAIFDKITEKSEELMGVDIDFLKSNVLESKFEHLAEMGVKGHIIKKTQKYFKAHIDKIRDMTFTAVGCHTDFSPRNILVGPRGKIVGLDLENFKYYWYFHSIALFLVYLDTLQKYGISAPYKLKRLKGAFLDGFQSIAGYQIDRDILHFFEIRYMTMVTANEVPLTKERAKLWQDIILRRMAKLYEIWINERL